MQTKAKIFITLKDITESGGGERVCVNLANAFQKIGFDVSIISFYHTNANIVYPLHEDIEVITIAKGSISKNFLLKAFYKIICRFYLSFKVCAIIANYNKSCELGYFGANKPTAKVRVLANDGFFIPFFKAKDVSILRLWHMKAPSKARKILRLFDMLIVLSSKELHIWKNYHNNIRVIPNFLPFNPVQDLNDSKSSNHKRTILSIGGMGRGDIKGFFRLIDIAKILKDICVKQSPILLNEWEWVIIGNGALQQEYIKKIQSLGLEDFLRIEDFRAHIEPAYKKSDIYCLTSYSEGFSMVLLEASIMGLACVSFDIASGPSDIIAHDKSGYLIKDNDLQDFALKTFSLMQADALRESMGRYAKQYVINKFSKEKIIPLWLNALE